MRPLWTPWGVMKEDCITVFRFVLCTRYSREGICIFECLHFEFAPGTTTSCSLSLRDTVTLDVGGVCFRTTLASIGSEGPPSFPMGPREGVAGEQAASGQSSKAVE